jgi:hypothetical protein
MTIDAKDRRLGELLQLLRLGSDSVLQFKRGGNFCWLKVSFEATG